MGEQPGMVLTVLTLKNSGNIPHNNLIKVRPPSRTQTKVVMERDLPPFTGVRLLEMSVILIRQRNSLNKQKKVRTIFQKVFFSVGVP